MSAVEKYTKKPVTIEAIRYNGPTDLTATQEFVGNVEIEVDWNHVTDEPIKETVNGFRHFLRPQDDVIAQVYDYLHNTWVGVKKGDFIIKGTKGEFYPCNGDTFIDLYSPAEVAPADADDVNRAFIENRNG